MRIIHCADLHLDSKMESNLNKEQAKIRRLELLDTFERMVDWAEANAVNAILVAGDMFDKGHIRKEAKKKVLTAIKEHPQIGFYYIRGNHDKSDFIEEGVDDVPSNLFMFSAESWNSYELENVVITGVELLSSNSGTIADRLVLDRAKTNIVMLHGQESNYDSKADAEIININSFKDKGIDYMALGHIHSYSLKTLDDRGVYCYSGCLEGRGFDETGDKGFVLLEILDGKIDTEFISFSARRLHEIVVEVDKDMDMMSVVSAVKNAVDEHDVDKQDLIKIVITGERDLDDDIDVNRIIRTFAENYFFVKCYDRTRTYIDYDSFLHDKTLKGEFVRLVQKQELSDDDKAAIIEMGIKAIMGEELD
ncbi:MAG: metallophosphoesterase [Pseudobutyrivibrio sp.]|nr:metallophosphoesterase [Pseudobutyrivibrio sp.]